MPSPQKIVLSPRKFTEDPLCDVQEPSERSRHTCGTSLESSMLPAGAPTVITSYGWESRNLSRAIVSKEIQAVPEAGSTRPTVARSHPDPPCANSEPASIGRRLCNPLRRQSRLACRPHPLRPLRHARKRCAARSIVFIADQRSPGTRDADHRSPENSRQSDRLR